ncbi:MAG: C1 family peptidase [Acidobacteriota bacterium]
MAPSYDVRDTAPDRVDLRDTLWPVENAGQIIASAASAAAVALEYHCNRMGEEPTNLSSMFIHYNARLATGQENSNTGTTMDAAMKAIATYGACREESWPFDAARFAVKPPASAYEEARKFAVVQGANPADIVEALALRYPVPFVAKLPERCLREAGRTGVMPAPASEELQKADGQVNHAMTLVGYDKLAKTFTARNCWGREWGDQGHCAISFDLMSVIAPYGTRRLWIITTRAQAGSIASQTETTGFHPAAAPPTAAPAARPERLADLAARMRDEIRGDLHRDLADSAKRIKDMIGRKPGAPQDVGTQTCGSCGGTGRCWVCRGSGAGCGSCGGTGSCSRCS